MRGLVDRGSIRVPIVAILVVLALVLATWGLLPKIGLMTTAPLGLLRAYPEDSVGGNTSAQTNSSSTNGSSPLVPLNISILDPPPNTTFQWNASLGSITLNTTIVLSISNYSSAETYVKSLPSQGTQFKSVELPELPHLFP